MEDVGKDLNQYFAAVFTRERQSADVVVKEEGCELLSWINILGEVMRDLSIFES